MDEQDDASRLAPQKQRLVELLWPAAAANLVIYVAAVLTGSLPLALLNPYWELRFIALLVDNGGFALMGFVLIHLAAWLDPANLRLELRCQQVRSLAVAVVLGFLLLIPLQSLASWNALAGQSREQAYQRQLLERQFAGWRSALQQASDARNLLARFKVLNGPGIEEADLRLPWPQLRQRLLEGLAKAKADALKAHPGPSNVLIWETIQESLRRMVAAFALALAFAAGARWPGEQQSLLEGWVTGWARRAFRMEQRRQWREQRRQLQDSVRAVELSRQPLPVPMPEEPESGPALPGLQYTFQLNSRLLELGADAAREQGQIADFLLAAVEDDSLVLALRCLPGGCCGLSFSRPVWFSAFTVAAGVPAGFQRGIGFREGDRQVLHPVRAWDGGMTYGVDWPSRIGPDEPLWMDGVWPQGLNQPAHSGDDPCLALEALTVVEPPPSLRRALAEEWDSWRQFVRRLLRRGGR
jgi:hypothetical protein